MRKILMLAIAGVAVLALAGSAGAAVTGNASDGWFVGKGDVQSLFFKNNAELQANYQGVTFQFDGSESTVITCEWFTGPGGTTQHVNDRDVSGPVASDVVLSAQNRKTGQDVTGWNVDGAGLSGGGTSYEVGDPCPGNPGNGATVIAVGATTTSGALSACYNNQCVVIWNS